MEIVKKKIRDIIPYGNNAKEHPKEQIEQIKKSIQEFGNNDPIALDENNVIIEGHGRLAALKELEYEEVECIVLHGLSEEQKKAYRLVHNQLTMNTGWDMDKLKSELIKFTNVNMDMLGFDKELLDIIKDEAIEIEEDDFDFDKELEEIEEVYVNEKDIYQLGRHYLMCGDTTSEDIESLMQGIKADLLVTDPPYNINVHNSQGMTIANDDMAKSDFIAFLSSCFKKLDSAIKEGAAFYIWYADSSAYEFIESCRNANWDIRQNLIWVKSQFILGRQDYQWRHEPCLYGWKEGAGHYFIKDRTQSTIIDDSIDLENATEEEMREYIQNLFDQTSVLYEKKPSINDLHPTMKPLKLIGKLIKNSSKRNQIILDGFGGSGSTLIACEELGRTCYMMEYDPKYAQTIIKRWETLTGKTAIKISD